jgi:tripartite-type tricarboxylate transporter receptor subunit TctC
MKLVLVLACITAASCGCGGATALAEDSFPTRAIHVIVPATAGGPVDSGIRVIEPPMSTILGVPLVLINRPGASGIVGMKAVAAAEPDGYTIGAGINSALTVVHLSGSTVPYSIDDFISIGNYATGVSILVVHRDSSLKTFEELVDFARANPGKLTYGSAGIGTVSSLAVQSVQAAFGLQLVEVPFAGGAQLASALLGQHVDVGFVPYSTAISALQDDRLRPLVTTARQRLTALPALPTLSERGVASTALNLVLGLYAPKGTPDATVKILADALERTVKDPGVREKFDKIGLIADHENPAHARAALQSEYDSVMDLVGKAKPAR